MNLVKLKTTEIKALRERLSKEQGGICPLCGKPLNEPCLDHQHKLKKTDEPGVDGAGLVRGVLCRDCNALEGRIWNAMSRHLQPKTVAERVEFLKKLVCYYNKDPEKILYPGCDAPTPKLSKRNFNQLKKLYSAEHPGAKPLEYPKSGKLTEKLKPLYRKYGVSPFNERA